MGIATLLRTFLRKSARFLTGTKQGKSEAIPAFGYSPRTRRFGHCDGGDDIPTDSGAWLRFLNHPFVAAHISKSQYPTLFGDFGTVPPLDETMAAHN